MLMIHAGSLEFEFCCVTCGRGDVRKYLVTPRLPRKRQSTAHLAGAAANLPPSKHHVPRARICMDRYIQLTSMFVHIVQGQL
jgi:hypothetical protein